MAFSRTSLVIALVATCALIIVSSEAMRPRWHQLDGYTFDQYKVDFGKDYSLAEESMRRDIFQARLAGIRRHNAGQSSYKRGVNAFSDRTDEEFKVRLGYRKDIGYLRRGDGAAPKIGGASMVRVQLPDSVDWRLKGVVTPVKDQGDCGSCWSFASAETIESMWALRHNDLATISEQAILSCTPNPDECGGTGGCGGGTAELAFSTIVDRNGKIASEWVYPYLSYRGKDFPCNATDRTPAAAHIIGVRKLPVNEQEPLMEAVAIHGPIAISVDASTWSDYESGVFDGCNGTNVDIDHAVQLVGYGTDETYGDYWLIRNSWAPTWGENGYIRLARPSTAPCAEDVTPGDGTACKGGPSKVRVCGVCGMLYDSSFPIVPL